jgi:hypothetical protein
MPKQRIVPVNFGKDAEEDMWKHVENTTDYWLKKTKNFRENTLKRYAKLYKGKPDQEVKNVPWANAANNVIQIVATDCDQLLSRVMAIYLMEPLWTAKILGDIDGEISGEDQRAVLETFLSESALNPNELDFYRVEQAWFSSAIRNGTGVIKFPWQYVVENQIIVLDGMDMKKPEFKEYVKYDNPKPENVPLNKWLMNLNFQKLEDSDYKAEIVTLSRYQLEERKQFKIYNDADIDKIISQPDRTGATVLQEFLEKSQGIDTTAPGDYNIGDEYDLIEAWFTWWHNGNKFSLCAHLHRKSETNLLCYYNYYPQNMSIYEDARLAYDDDQYLGYGLAEMLEGYQEEISTAHNQKTDAGTLNNTTAFRINKSSKLHSLLTFYPGVMVPADKDEIERLDTSNAHANDTNMESITRAYAKERSGVDAAIGGTGGGIVNNKRGIYSSQGTFAVMQQQNNRTNLRTSDMRSAHTRAGDKFLKMYAHFGLGTKLRSFGKNAETMKTALENVKDGKLGLLIRPTTASINKELERQNDILLTQMIERLQTQDAQIMQLLTTQQMPEELKQYYIEMLKARNALMHHILRDFGHEDAARLIPLPAFLKENKNGPGPSPRALPQSVPQQRQNAGTVPIGGMEDTNRLPS